MSTPMTLPERVAIVSRADHGGHPRYCAEVARALAEQGADVTIIEPAEAFTSQAMLQDTSVKNEAIRGPEAGWVKQEIDIARHLLSKRRTGGTVLFQDTSPARVVLISLLRALTEWTPITMVHNTQPHVKSVRERLKHRASLAALAIPHRVLVHNERQRSELLKSRFVRSSDIDVVPHGVWSDEPAIDLTDATMLEHSGRHGLLLFGVMRSNTGLETLVDIAPVLDEELAEGQLAIVGRPANDDVKRQLAQLNAHRSCGVRAEFVSDADMDRIFASTRFLLLPYSDYSSESGVLMQAIARSIPVITAGDTSIADRVRKLGLGPSPDGRLLDQIRAAMACSPAEYAHWQRNLTDARSEFNWADQATQILAR